MDVLSAGAGRQRDERKQYLYAANAEIDELKDGLKYAEFQLTRVMQEKEALEKDKKTHAYQVGDLNMQLRQRDIEYQKKDEMFKQMEGALMQKNFEQKDILHQTSDKFN